MFARFIPAIPIDPKASFTSSLHVFPSPTSTSICSRTHLGTILLANHLLQFPCFILFVLVTYILLDANGMDLCPSWQHSHTPGHQMHSPILYSGENNLYKKRTSCWPGMLFPVSVECPLGLEFSLPLTRSPASPSLCILPPLVKSHIASLNLLFDPLSAHPPVRLRVSGFPSA